jgi:hypothetical protein
MLPFPQNEKNRPRRLERGVYAASLPEWRGSEMLTAEFDRELKRRKRRAPAK